MSDNLHNKRLSAVRGKDTKPELSLRRALWKKGLRYRIHVPELPGRPDVVFIGSRVAVFVDGNFWHGYDWENLRPRLKSRYWVQKIATNMQRDRENTKALRAEGWTVIRIWEHEINNDVEACVARIEQEVKTM